MKLFPAGAFDRPTFVRALLNPSPWARVMPTSVPPTEEHISSYSRASAAAVGVEPDLITDDLQDEADPSVLAARIRDLLDWIREARQ